MNITVTLCYEEATKNREITIAVKDSLKGARLMNAIDKAVEKAAKDDRDWNRWNLKEIAEGSA